MAQNESLVLDGLALNDGTTLTLEALTMAPPPKRPEWIGGADSHGAILGRDPLHENRVIEMRLRIEQQTTMDLALAKIALVVDKLEECERNANGLALVWTPADATLAAITFRCLSGEITEMPITVDGEGAGWFVKAPVLSVRLTCLPLAEGDETLLGSVTSSEPLVALEVSGAAGDAPALGRLVVTDAASKARRWLAWGLESRWYPTSSPPSLIVDSASMVTTGYAGATATRSGAYSGASNNVISTTLLTQPQPVCGLGNLPHVGTFRPQLRFYASAPTMVLRLAYQSLDGPFRSLSYKVPATAGWNLVDLGLVNVPKAALGAQRWTGQIEAYSTASGGEVLDIDVMLLMPAERFGRARAAFTYKLGVVSASDAFTGVVGGLNGRVAPAGGTWATSGAATDFSAATNAETRTTTAVEATPRFAILGSTTYSNIEVGFSMSSLLATGAVKYGLLIARWVDANNYAFVQQAHGLTPSITVGVVVAGVTTTIATSSEGNAQLRLIVFASGRIVALASTGTVLAEGQHAALATGGALASGKVGFADRSADILGGGRTYDDFHAALPTTEPVVCHSGQSIEFRSDSTLRKDSTGTYAGPPPEDIGPRFVVPCAGGPGRKTRVAVIARQNDIESAADDNIADSTTLQVYATPRYLAVPR